MKIIEIHQLTQSSPVKITGNIINAYQKGDMYCVMYEDSSANIVVDKFPLKNIFRVREITLELTRFILGVKIRPSTGEIL